MPKSLNNNDFKGSWKIDEKPLPPISMYIMFNHRGFENSTLL